MRRPDDGQNFSIYFVQEEEVTVFLLKQGLMFWMRKLKLGTAKDGEKDVSDPNRDKLNAKNDSPVSFANSQLPRRLFRPSSSPSPLTRLFLQGIT
jgi:hypothetical protein